MLGISEAASLALHAAALLAADGAGRIAARELAQTMGASEAHLAKVLNRLSRAGIVRLSRGPGGGAELARSAAEISLLEVYQAVEGPLRNRTCLLAKPICDGQCCLLGGLLAATNRQVGEHLAKTRLSELCAGGTPRSSSAANTTRAGRERS